MRADDPQGLALGMQIGDQSPARFQPRQVDAMDGIDLGLVEPAEGHLGGFEAVSRIR